MDETTDQKKDDGHAKNDIILLDEENSNIDLNFPLDRSESRINIKSTSSPNPIKIVRRGREGISKISKKIRTGKNK